MEEMHGHILGLLVAGIGMVLLVIWMSLASIRAKWGARRWGAAFFVINVLLFIALVGNGESGVRFRGVQGMVGTPAVQAAFSSALDTALSEEFLRYDAALHEGQLLFEPSTLPPRLHLLFESVENLRRRGIDRSDPPGTQILTYDHVERSNIIARWIGVGLAVGNLRMAFVRRLTNDYAEELVSLALYRQARSDVDRLAALDRLSSGVPHSAEWITRALRRFTEQTPSPPVQERIQQLRLEVERHVVDPTLRGIPASTRIDLDDLPPAPPPARRGYAAE